MHVLPLGLIDLTLLRASNRLHAVYRPTLQNLLVRKMHALAVKPRTTFVAELERKVQTLQETNITETSFLDMPGFTEEELRTVYEDLLVIHPPQVVIPKPIKVDHRNSGLPTDKGSDLHVKALLQATPHGVIPTSALSAIHKYEEQGQPPSIPTYTRAIGALLSSHSSLGNAQAWDLFAHMRYVAHTTPDLHLYTLMIRACALPSRVLSEAERALDLWTEMTVDRAMTPSAKSFNAIILVCARSGQPSYISEAFRLAKEMLDSHRDARGRSAYEPDRETFAALLEGAKRVGDIGRTRWILAEMVKGSDGDRDENGRPRAIEIDEEIMMHVFHAYAAYRPPFKRSATRLLEPQPETKMDQVQEADHTPEQSSTSVDSSELPTIAQESTFTHLPPQTSNDVISEAGTLFRFILRDSQRDVVQEPHPNTFDPIQKQFDGVQLTPRLWNAYLSVYYSHSKLEASRELFNTIFSEHGVQKNSRSYVEALERCAISRRDEREVAVSFAEEVWGQWQSMERQGSFANARMIERAHRAMIRMWTLSGDLDRALNQVKSFAHNYPPVAVRTPAPKHAMRSTRTVLTAPRPLIRLKSAIDVPDDTVPPLLTFTDLEILHHRLVEAGRRGDIGYLKYICKAYEGALRTRRNLTMHAEPISNSIDHTASTPSSETTT